MSGNFPSIVLERLCSSTSFETSWIQHYQIKALQILSVLYCIKLLSGPKVLGIEEAGRLPKIRGESLLSSPEPLVSLSACMVH